MTNTESKKVSWTIFTWTIGIIIVIFGVIITYSSSANNKSDMAMDKISNVEGDIKAINKTLEFQQASLLRIESKLDKK